MNKHLVLASNRQGYIVKSIESWGQNQFGPQDIIIIEGGQYRIKFNTNVLHGKNYFLIHEVTDYLNKRTYKASRYHHKFISLLISITSDTHRELNKEKEEQQ